MMTGPPSDAAHTLVRKNLRQAPWVRTGLVSLAAGVGAKKTLGGVLPDWAVVLTGSVLVAFAAFCFIAAVWRELSPGAPPPQPDVRQLPRVLLFAGARRAVRRLVWAHWRDLTLAARHSRQAAARTLSLSLAFSAVVATSQPAVRAPGSGFRCQCGRPAGVSSVVAGSCARWRAMRER